MEQLQAILIAGIVGGLVFTVTHLYLAWRRRREDMRVLLRRLRA